MAIRKLDSFHYVDDGDVILKTTWVDDETGETWDTFETTTQDKRARHLQAGTVVAGPDDPSFTRYDPQDLGRTGYSWNWQMTGANPSPNTQASAQARLSQHAAQNQASGRPPGLNTTIAAPAGPQSPPRTGDRPSYAANEPAPPRNAGSGYAPPQRNEGGNPMSLPGGGTPPNPSGSGGADPRTQRGAALYNWANPQDALANVLRDMGVSTYTDNPAVNMLMRAGQGLGNAYQIQSALQGQAPRADDYDGFRSYLDSAIRGGNVYGTLAQTQSQLPALFSRLRDFGNAVAQNQQGAANPLLQNTFLSTLYDQMRQDPANVTGLMTSLATPMMNRNSALAYQNLMGQIEDQAIRRFFDPNTPNYNTLPIGTLWQYILGSF